MKLNTINDDPINAIGRHLNFSIKQHTRGDKNKGRDCNKAGVKNTNAGEFTLLKQITNSLVNIPNDNDTPSAIK